MEKGKNPQAGAKNKIELKEDPKVSAMKSLPDEVILRAIREVIRKDKEKIGR